MKSAALNFKSRKSNFLIGVFVLLFFSFTIPQVSQTCKTLPAKFSSYSEALRRVKAADFEIQESQDCRKSSWILKASYHSCDGKTGFFILTTKSEGKEYIHQGVPYSLWLQFKKSDSFGGFYNQNLKGRYQLRL